MANELTEIEVDEVSLVDRPATGRRFVLFKRGGLLRKPAEPKEEEDTNICSVQATDRLDGIEKRLDGLDALEKRARDAESEVTRLRVQAAEMEERLTAVEQGSPTRQSAEENSRQGRLWAGVL